MEETEEDMDKETKRYEDMQDAIAEKDKQLKVEAEKLEGVKEHVEVLKGKLKASEESKKELQARLLAQVQDLMDKNQGLRKQMSGKDEQFHRQLSSMSEDSKKCEELQRIIAEKDRKLEIEGEKIEGLKDHIGTLKEKIKGHDEAKKELENRLQA